MSLTYEVLLVRHGESQANADGRFAYHSWDPHLTETGRAQAALLADQLKDTNIQHIVTSPLLRARETVLPLSLHHHLDPIVVADLAEVNLGIWDGKRLVDLENSGNMSFEAWRRDPEENPPPGGESILTVGRRVLNSLQEFVTHQEPGFTVAGTHADCIKGAVLVITRAQGPTARAITVPNCGQLLIRYHPTFRRWTLMLNPLYVPNSLT